MQMFQMEGTLEVISSVPLMANEQTETQRRGGFPEVTPIANVK